jgi:Glyoxalase-like domain
MPWLHTVIDVPPALHATAAEFWSQALGWPAGSPWTDHQELSSFEPPDGDAYVHLQRIDGPPRVHVDLEADNLQETVAKATSLGAAIVNRADRWWTLSSPGGLPFCVIPARPHTAPAPATWPDGHRSRMVQVCIDSPRDKHEAEVEFWKALLPGRWVSSPAHEFAGKWHDDAGAPLQLLFQRLGEPDGTVRAHLDHGTDALAAEVRRLVGLGAVDLGPGRGGWQVLRDPAGSTFCVTKNAPDQTRHRDIG